MHRFTFYGQKPGVLCQFVLAEFLITYAEVKTIQNFCNNLAAATDWQLSKMMGALSQLTGSPLSDHNSPWESYQGALEKLKYLTTSFAEFSGQAPIQDLSGAVNRAFFAALEARDILPSFLRRPLQKDRLQATVLCTPHLRRLSENIERVANLIPSIVQEHRGDENVLLFVVKKRADFDSLYGTSFTKNLLLTMFPEGLRDLQTFVEERYRERGFKKIAETVGHKLADIQLTSP